MRRRTLFSQVLLVNAVVTGLLATGAVFLLAEGRPELGRVIALAVLAATVSTVLNHVLLSRRFGPLEILIEDMEKVDLSRPGANLPDSFDGTGETEEVERIELAFLQMMKRLEAERRRTTSAALTAQERERTRVARDLHDEVNQSLTGLLLRLEAARSMAPPELAAELDETKAVANRAMRELLTVARRLRPAALDDHGLEAALNGLVELLAESDVEVDFKSTAQDLELAEEVQLVIYRVAQEALSNVARHSEADRVRVRLEPGPGQVKLTVRDNGRGFAFDQAGAGLGLAGMRERALLVGGELEIESGAGAGTSVTLTVPLASITNSAA